MAPPAEAGKRRRVGVFGGTFDPPHLGHLSVARDVAEALDLDEVLWVPARRSPHKGEAPGAPAHTRLRMVQAAVDGDPLFTVSDIELNRSEPSYTVDTLRELSRSGGDASPELFLIMGVDQFRRFREWRCPDEVARLATLVVMDREGESFAPSERDGDGDGAPGIRVPVRRIDVSSTGVRAAVEGGEAFEHMVPDGVAEIIRAETLYRGPGRSPSEESRG